jgi:hypothetical protein
VTCKKTGRENKAAGFCMRMFADWKDFSALSSIVHTLIKNSEESPEVIQ